MSKIGKKTIEIPAGIKIEVNEGIVKVTGTKGSLELDTKKNVLIEITENEVKVMENTQIENSSAFWGLYRALIANMINGVNEGFEKVLELHGVGYRANGGGRKITLSLGFSHPIDFEVPEGIEIIIEDQTKIRIKGMDKALIGQVAANIRKFRKPEPYKGKGIRYEGEVVRRKVGKTGVA